MSTVRETTIKLENVRVELEECLQRVERWLNISRNKRRGK
jgi:hypothetical protein